MERKLDITFPKKNSGLFASGDGSTSFNIIQHPMVGTRWMLYRIIPHRLSRHDPSRHLQAENALSVLALANRSDIPVYIGAEPLCDEEL